MPAPAETRFDKQLELVFGAAGSLEIVDYARKVASATEFTEAQLVKAMYFLGRGGFAAKDIEKPLAAAMDAAAFASSKTNGLADAIDALIDIKENERASATALAAFGLARPAFVREASRRGLSTNGADDCLTTVYLLITKKTGKSLGGAAVHVASGTSPPGP